MSPSAPIRDVVEEAVLADELGLDFFGVGEHHRADFAISAPEVVLAGIAARTTRIHLGSAVTVLSSDEPVRVFQPFSTLDAVARGRAVRLDSVTQQSFDAVFYPGGHGPLWDLAEDKNSIALLESFVAAGKSVALVCHAPGALRHVKAPDGTPLVQGKKVTGFANTEEEAVQLTNIVPFLVEDELKAKGGIYSKTEDWASYHRRPTDYRSKPRVLGCGRRRAP